MLNSITNLDDAELQDLETSAGGRLGIYAINTDNNKTIQLRVKERFPFCSTAKVIVASAILQASMNDPYLLESKLKYTQQQIEQSGYAPKTTEGLVDEQGEMTISKLCEIAITHSDNMAMNLLIKQLGGTEKINEFARFEPELNSAIPEDSRDTTTPIAMVTTLRELTLGNILASEQRELLNTWLRNNTTGNTRIRAGVPKNWRVGDKTGGGNYNTANDMAIIWPPEGKPIILGIYYTNSALEVNDCNKVIALATRQIITKFAPTGSLDINFSNAQGVFLSKNETMRQRQIMPSP